MANCLRSLFAILLLELTKHSLNLDKLFLDIKCKVSRVTGIWCYRMNNEFHAS